MFKTRSKSEEKRLQILNSAIDLFTSQGYATTSMDTVAKKAEVSKQTVYSHFGNKDELFAAAISARCKTFELLDINVQEITDVRETLLWLAQRFFALLISPESIAVHKLCAYESDSYPKLSELFYHAGPKRVIGEVEQLMAELDNQGHLSIDDPHIAAVHFLATIKGDLWLRVEFNVDTNPNPEEVNAYLAHVVDHFIRGYRK